VHAARTPSEVLDSVERFFEHHATCRGVDRSAVARNEDPAHGPSQSVRVQAALGT
jgi:hypothetical protein